MFKPFPLHGRVLGTALSAFVLSSGAQAAPESSEQAPAVDKRIVAARVFIEESRPELACALIKYSHGADTRVPDALYLLALCSRDLGRMDESTRYYERLAEVLPDAPKPKAELAALYAAAGRSADSQRLYSEAARLQPGTPGAELFSQLASAIISDDPAQLPASPKLWEASVGVTMVHDSNLNSGPTATTTAAVIGGVPVQLTLHPSMRPRSSWGRTLSAGGRYLMPISERWAVLYQGDFSNTEYFSEDGFNTDSQALGVALIYRGPTYTASIQPNARYVRQDSEMQEATHGVSVNLGRRLSPSLQLGGAIGYFNRRVPVADSHDADGYTASVSLQKALSNRLQLGGQYLYQREVARLGSQARTLHGPSLFAVYQFGEQLQLLGNYRYVAIDYDERQPLFGSAREDEQQQVSLAAKLSLRRWTGHDLELLARYSYTDNESNLSHNDYDRKLATLGLQANF